MNIIIDIQGLRGRDKEFVPKEVAVIVIQTGYLDHWIVKPPYEYDQLPPVIKRQNGWLSANAHGLEWFEGETSLRLLETSLKRIAVRAKRIFTRGSEKSSYLTQLTGCFVINLEDEEDSPSFQRLPQSDTRCMFHGVLNQKYTLKCALNNAIRIKEWLCHGDRIGSIWEYRTTTSWCIGLSATAEEEEKEKEQKPVNNEQPSDPGISTEYKGSYGGRIPSRSYPEGVDETDGIRS